MWEDETVLQMDGGDGKCVQYHCTEHSKVVTILKISLCWKKKMVKMINFMLHVFSHYFKSHYFMSLHKLINVAQTEAKKSKMHACWPLYLKCPVGLHSNYQSGLWCHPSLHSFSPWARPTANT